jgi:hypothetical protein
VPNAVPVGISAPTGDPLAATDDVEPSPAEVARRAVRILYGLLQREEAP